MRSVVVDLAVWHHEVCSAGRGEGINREDLIIHIPPDAVVEAQVGSHRDLNVGVQPRDKLPLDEGHVLGTARERDVVDGDITQTEGDSGPQLAEEAGVMGTDDTHQSPACRTWSDTPWSHRATYNIIIKTFI